MESSEQSAGEGTAVETRPRYVVGIDLGTTNCAVAYVDSEQTPWQVRIFEIPQWTDWGQFERRTTLPSFHYQLTEQGRSACTAGLPWESEPPHSVVGVLARDAGSQQPGRRIASAKSWLSHDGVDRSADLLPWHGDVEVARMSPVAVSAAYLGHIRAAWDNAYPEAPLAEQDVVVTLPASFDEVARELTVAAAKQAGLPRIFLIEEPQAAFYAWIDHHRDDWQQLAAAGQTILVCDIGGGTSDFTLIRVRSAGGSAGENSVGDQTVQFHRVAVGDHLILGGDNLDLALAKFAEQRLSGDNPLPPRDWDRLIQACRDAKETLLGANPPEQISVTLAGAGSRLIGGARSLEISRREVAEVLVDGFFPRVDRDARPREGESGFREFGLPYASDPAITRHLAAFLSEHARAGLSEQELQQASVTGSDPGRPDLVLFNGGVMNAPQLRERIVESISGWYGDAAGHWRPTVLEANRLDLAVAQGAAYFGMVRRGQGVRIAANLGRSYYMQVADSPPETMCLIPGSAEAGQTYTPDAPLRLQVGQPVQFPLWVSSTRLADAAGTMVALQREQLSPLPPIRTVLKRGRQRSSEQITVRIETGLSEIGTLGLYCVDQDTGKRWKLEFDIRATLETDRALHRGSGEAEGIVDSETADACAAVLRATFGNAGPAGRSLPAGEATVAAGEPIAPSKVVRKLREAADLDRSAWPPSLLRELWSVLMRWEAGRRQSAAHETRWLNLVGYCLRPGYGMAVDDWRVGEVWRAVHGKLAFATPGSRTESLILWRRIAGGLTAGQQQQLAAPLRSQLTGGGGKLAAHEAAELWRLVGALECLDADVKRSLAAAGLRELGRKKAAPYHDAVLWAMGRLLTRRPVYGPLNTVVPAEVAAELLEGVMAGESEAAMRQLAVMQAARHTGDRFLDLDAAARRRALGWLRQQEAPPRYLEAVERGGQLSAQDATAVFGESLPLGIQLVRGAG